MKSSKLHVAFILLCLATLTATAQVDFNQVYPVFEKYKKKKWDDSEYVNKVAQVKCLEGDCQNGVGVKLTIHLISETKYHTGDSKFGYKSFKRLVYEFSILKGTFSDWGRTFKGDVYAANVVCENEYKSKDVIAINSLNITEMASDPKYSVYSGDLKYVSIDGVYMYVKEDGSRLEVLDVDPYLMAHDTYKHNETGLWEETTYLPEAKKDVQYRLGIKDSGHDYILVRQTYANGTTYEGFLLEGKRNGSGIVTNASNELVQSGLWLNDSLVNNFYIYFPKGVFEVKSTANNYQPATLTIEQKPVAGHIIRDDESDIVFFVSDDHNLFYHGQVEADMPNGLGAFMNLQSAERQDQHKIHSYRPVYEDYQEFKLGLFVNSDIKEGKLIRRRVHTDMDHELKPFVYLTTVYSGWFLNGKMNGCTFKEYKVQSLKGTFSREFDKPATSWSQGEMQDDNYKGWYVTSNYTGASESTVLSHARFNGSTATLEDAELIPLDTNYDCIKAFGHDVPAKAAELKARIISNVKNKESEKARNEQAFQNMRINQERCAKANALVGYVVSYKGTTIYPVAVNCGTSYIIIVNDTVKDGAYYSDIPMSEVVHMVATNETHSRHVCTTCNGMGYTLGSSTVSNKETQGAYTTYGTDYNYSYGPSTKTTSRVVLRRITCKVCDGLGLLYK